jgi:Cell wall-associated hydrolases (invasion-associated proteins)
VPKHKPGLAIRAAVVATATAAATIAAVLPAATATAAPLSPAPTAPVSAPVAPVALPVIPVALATPAPAAITAPSAATSSAVQSALSKIGSPYRWGATGPNAFDCSGLVTWAFKKAGVSLPRTSRAMSTVGTPVAKSDLRPGDLVFFYKPVSHVAIYIGNGKVVHASSSKRPVMISDLNRMPFNSARRV